MRWHDRTEAGEALAQALHHYKDQGVVVYALPRGGVVLGAIVARALNVPFDLLIPRKIGHPYNPEYAIAAVTEDGHYVANEAEIASLDSEWFKAELVRQQKEAQRRRAAYLANRQPIPLDNKTAIIVDDGIATGLTMRAAIQTLKARQPKKIIVAVPVAPVETVELLKRDVAEVVVLDKSGIFLGAVGAYYDDFSQVSDDDVIQLMQTVPSPL